MKKEEEELEMNMKKLKEELEIKLKDEEDKLMTQLRIDLLKEYSPSTKELERRWRKGEYYYLSAKDNVISTDSEKLKDFLDNAE